MKKISLVIMCGLFGVFQSSAQSSAIREGNKLYKEGRYDDALVAYDKAGKKDPGDLTAMYNRTNTLAKKGDKTAAMDGYYKLIAEGRDAAIRQRSYYDKGVLHQQQQQLDESISAWKSAVILDPEDKMARENLEKALREKKKQEQKKDEQKKDQKDKKEQDKPKPEPQQSKLNQKQVEQLLKALEQKEKEVQKKLQQRTASSHHPEKDW
ncbi:tetratricopeptide repeat protein [Flavihumibacter fluvii]|uniref:tetratricopeptide repeat protein n=1 Tax=Flavihumibacter fluvii TaxID=2838157 RepID=UPI001BDF24B7|nr:tetratricopeptide repeat protein [Flavihumibacter fluvii]ULQ52345.1 tetratricopeptide repeat protein [Flavihumibacter fluvii]